MDKNLFTPELVLKERRRSKMSRLNPFVRSRALPDACLARGRGRGAFVTDTWPCIAGLVGKRMRRVRTHELGASHASGEIFHPSRWDGLSWRAIPGNELPDYDRVVPLGRGALRFAWELWWWPRSDVQLRGCGGNGSYGADGAYGTYGRRSGSFGKLTTGSELPFENARNEISRGRGRFQMEIWERGVRRETNDGLAPTKRRLFPPVAWDDYYE